MVSVLFVKNSIPRMTTIFLLANKVFQTLQFFSGHPICLEFSKFTVKIKIALCNYYYFLLNKSN